MYMRTTILLLVSLVLAGCASVGARPWQRGQLAERKMQFVSHPLDTAADDHTYFSKEASSGGRGFGGGGCGCN